MAKVTSKLQVTLPKRIAEAHGIAPGDQIEFESLGDDIRIVVGGGQPTSMLSREERLRLFDEASQRIAQRAGQLPEAGQPGERGWKREDLYTRGMSGRDSTD